MRLRATRLNAIGNSNVFSPFARASLDLRFADTKSLTDAVTGQSLVTFTRASSGTVTDSAGVLQTATTDVPRFDHNPATGESLGLLVEEQRTNLAINAGDVVSGGTGGVVVANQITAPDGSLADFFQEDTSSNEHYAGDRAPSVTAGTTYTWSFYAKLGLTGEARRVCVRAGGQGPANVIFDLQTASSTVIAPVVSSGISSAGNGWFRCWLVYTATGTGVAVFRQQLAKGVNTVYTGNGISGLFFWGAQLEVGAFPTSYIPTINAQATRAADVPQITGANFSSWYNQTEGTVFSAFSIPTSITTGNARVYSISNNGATNQVWLRLQGGTTRLYEVTDSSIQQAVLSAGTLSAGVVYRGAVGLKTNDFGFSENGSTPTVDNSGTLGAVIHIGIGCDASGVNPLNGHIRRLTYWPQRLPNHILQKITQ